MATTKVRAPSGEVIEIQHPEGATQAEIIGYAKANFAKNVKAQDGTEKYKRAASEDGGGTNFLAAFGGALPKALELGVKGIFNQNQPGEVQDWKDSMAGLNSSMAGKLGSGAGMAAPMAAAAMVPGGNTVLGSMLTGAGYEGLQPVGEGESRAGNMVRGAVLNGAVPAGVATFKTGRALVDPLTSAGQERIAGRVLNRFASDPAKLAGASGGRTLSGTFPTLAESTGDLGVANLQNILQSRDPRVLLANRYADNNAARIAALEGLGGTDAQLNNALARRKAIGDSAYDRARNAGVDQQAAEAIRPKIDSLLSRPSIKEAAEKAKAMALDDGIAINDLGSPQGLKYLKQQIDDMALSAAPKSNAARIYGNLSSELDGVMREIVPDMTRADRIYARLSREPNRMQTARALKEDTTSALRDFNGDPKLYAEKYASTLNKGAERSVKTATGMKRTTLGEIMSPDDMKLLEDIRKTAESQANAMRPRMAGSTTARNLIGDDILSRISGPLGVPQSWAQGALAETVLSRPASWALKSSEERLNDTLLKGLLDPAYASVLIKKAQPTALARKTGAFLEKGAPVYQGLLAGSAPLLQFSE